MSTRRVKFNFKSGENVLCFEPDSSKAKVLYDAKILDVSVSTDKKGKRKPTYLIHFLGWNNSWDRVVPESFLLKNTDENRMLMKKLETISQRIKSNKTRMKKIDYVLKRFFERRSGSDARSLNSASADYEHDNSSSGEMDDEEQELEEDLDDDVSENNSVESEMSAEENSTTQSSIPESFDMIDDDDINDSSIRREPVCFDLSEPLKRKLEKDFYLVKQQDKLLKLPAHPNVITVLEGYVKSFAVNVLCAANEKQRHQLRSQKQHTPDKSIQLCKEMVDGLRVIFDFAFPLCLLYESEVAQYNDVIQKSFAEQKLMGTEIVEPSAGSSSKLTTSIEFHCLQQRGDKIFSRDLSNESDDAMPTLSDTASKIVVKKEEDEFELPSKRVTRNSGSLISSTAKKKVSAQSNRSLTRSASKIGKIKGSEEGQSSHSQRDTRRSCTRSHDDIHSHDAVVEGPRSSQRCAKFELHDAPQLLQQLESEPSETSSFVTQLLSQPEIKSVYSQKEKEVSGIVAWKLVPDELHGEVPAPPSLIYGAHHLLRLFVHLPDLLNRMEISADKQILLVKHLQLFLDHLTVHCEDLFPESSFIS